MEGQLRAPSDDDDSTTGANVESLVVQPPDARGITAVSWTVDSERLGSSEHKLSSPAFRLAVPGWGWAFFQLLIYAHNKSKVLTFGEAGGQGRVELKCLEDLPEKFGTIAYSMKVGEQLPSPWFLHDFSRTTQRSERRLNFADLADGAKCMLTVDAYFVLAMEGQFRAPSDDDDSTTGANVESLVVQPPDARGITAVSWTVDSGRLGSSEHKLSSPAFRLAVPGWGWASFQLLIYAHNKSKVLTFGEAGGQGRAELKCLEDLPEKFGTIAYSMKVGDGPPCPWFLHDFSRTTQRSERRLNFADLADGAKCTLAVEAYFVLDVDLGQNRPP